MSNNTMAFVKELFLSRLETLSHILDVSSSHFEQEGDAILNYRIVDDMLPFGTQIVFTCNQPYNFARWCNGEAMENLPPEPESIEAAKAVIEETKRKLLAVNVDDKTLAEERRIDLSETQYLELPGPEYVNDFLIPNCYFHLVTAYNIMRMKGAPLGKANYMLHLLPKVKSA